MSPRFPIVGTRPGEEAVCNPGFAASSHRRAFTLVEAAISTVIVAVMLVAALTTVGASRLAQQRGCLVSRGWLMAEALMSEILLQGYREPGDVHVFGCEPGESATSRAAYDDVDDYHGWSSSPPIAKDGTMLFNAAGWKRTVTVEWVDATNPGQPEPSETGAKRVTVTVAYNNVPQATLVAIRTAHE